MKIFTNAAYEDRIREERIRIQTEFSALHGLNQELHCRNSELAEKNARLSARARSAEARVQELTLLCGMKGYAVEMTPDTPAVPAKPGVLTLTRIAKP